MKKPLLSPDLEYAVLYAITKGACGTDVVAPEELSKVGKIVLQSISSLAVDGHRPPYSPTSVALVAIDVLGQPREVVRQYLQALETATAGSEIKDVLHKVRAKQVLVELINEASTMLGKGILDVGLLNTVITRDTGASDIQPLSEVIKDGFPDPPQGVVIDSLPAVTKATGGLYGIWAISGEPGAGKTALAWQIALDVGQKMKVIYEDFENGLPVLADRTRQIVGGDHAKALHLTRNMYYRNSIRTLDADLAMVPPPAVIVIDSVQKLPGSSEHRREALDKWVHRLENLKKRGYHVLLISEIPRSQYNQDAYIGAFKETGALEYAADMAMQLIPGQDNTVECHVVKSRHRPQKGYITMLARHNNWRYKELGSPGDNT